jgi:hypothetical protein
MVILSATMAALFFTGSIASAEEPHPAIHPQPESF